MGAGLRQSGRGVNVLGTFLRVWGEGQLRRGVAGVAVSALRQACVDSSSGNVGFGEGLAGERQPALVQQTGPCFFIYVERRVPLPEQ